MTGPAAMYRIVRNTGLVVAGIATATVPMLWRARTHDVAAIRRLKARLEHPRGVAVETFDPAMVADLPELARRYFLHAIRPGALLAHAVRLAMVGQMRLGPRQSWLGLSARQSLAPPAGFVWEANVGAGLLRFSGADRYLHGEGRVTFRLWDLVPIVTARGADIARSARGRLAIESIWQPAALLPQRGVTWATLDDQTVQATLTIDGERIPLALTLASNGRLQAVAIERWGNLTDDGRFTLIPFGADVLGEQTFGGYTVPSDLTVDWWRGTERAFAFFRARITHADYLPSESKGALDHGPNQDPH